MEAVIEVIAGGPGTTVQDAGRSGFRRFGIALSGALDPIWLACANALVGNAPETAALELRLAGPRLRVAAGRVRVALAGAADVAVSRRLTFAAWQSLMLEEGDEIAVGTVRGGVAYLGFSGGIDTPPLLGSRATHPRARLGGIEGRALAAGDRLPLGAATAQGFERRQSAFLHERGPIRLLPGPQDDHFAPETLSTLVRGEYAVTREADRMGLRLDGPRLQHDARFGDEIVSDGVAPGSIQVPPDGRPIVLAADCQTVGGYPKIATVIRADLPRLAHLAPGDRLGFSLVSRELAVSALRKQRDSLNAWRDGIAPYRPAGDLDEEALYSANLISGALFDADY